MFKVVLFIYLFLFYIGVQLIYNVVVVSGVQESDLVTHILMSGFPGGTSGKESACQCRRLKTCWFDPWVMGDTLEEEIATHSSILSWKFHGQRSLVDYTQSMGLQSRTQLKRLSTYIYIYFFFRFFSI